MNKHLKKFVAIMVGCSVIIGGASFAGEKSTADKMKTTLEDNGMYIEEMDDMYDQEGEDYEIYEIPENGDDFVKELKEIFPLTDKEASQVEKLYDEAMALEGEDGAGWEKATSKWDEIDNVLKKYEIAEIMGQELPKFEDFLNDLFIDKGKLSSDQMKTLENFRSNLEKHKKAGDADKFGKTYDDLFTWIDENIEDNQWCEFDESELDFEGDFDDEFEGMSEEEINKMIFEEIKAYSAEDFLKDFPIEFSDEDVKTIKSLYADIVKAAEAEDMDKIDALYEKLDEVINKYEDKFDKYYDELDQE